ncbi:MAG: LysE family translocator [Aestuariivirgaceae bacterium]
MPEISAPMALVMGWTSNIALFQPSMIGTCNCSPKRSVLLTYLETSLMPETLLPLIWFALAAAMTPGPNNIMVTASAVNFGFRGTLNHMLGIAFGFGFMILAIGFGLGQLFNTVPQLHTMLRWAGTAYLIYLAWRIATAGRPEAGGTAGRPLTFLQAALFQWVNPKAWMMSVSALSAFTVQGSQYTTGAIMVAAVFFLITFPAVSIWCLFGTAIARFLQSDKALQIFNWTMASLIIASIVILYL